MVLGDIAIVLGDIVLVWGDIVLVWGDITLQDCVLELHLLLDDRF